MEKDRTVGQAGVRNPIEDRSQSVVSRLLDGVDVLAVLTAGFGM